MVGPSKRKLKEVNLETLGGRLRFERILANKTQLQVWKKRGVSTSHLSFLETDQSHPSLETLKALAEEYNVTADWLVFGVLRPGAAKQRSQRDLERLLQRRNGKRANH